MKGKKRIKITPEITSTNFENTIKALMQAHFPETIGVGRVEVECSTGESMVRIISIEDSSTIKEFKFNTWRGDKIHLTKAVIVFQIEMSKT
jgi:hypothetical protein